MIKAIKVWWIGGILYSYINIGYSVYLKDYSQIINLISYGLFSTMGLIYTIDLEKNINN